MKTVSTGSLTLGLALAFLPAAAAAQSEPPAVKLIDMFAKGDGERYRIYIIATGDIGEYRSSRQTDAGESSYKLILDVPALPPLDARYNLETPFSGSFEVWPMILGQQTYTRISIELDVESSSVIGQDNPTTVTITLSRRAPEEAARPPESAPTEDEPREPVEVDSDSTSESPPAPSTSDALPPLYRESEDVETGLRTGREGSAAPDPSQPDPSSVEQEYYNLFPAPVRRHVVIGDFRVDEIEGADDYYDGIRLGRFLVRPTLYASWLRGTNLLLRSDAEFEDSALHIQARTSFELMDSENSLQFNYEIHYRDYQTFQLSEKVSHFFDFGTKVYLSPRTSLTLQDHFANGSYESFEYDLGRELPFNSEPFVRNVGNGAIQFDFSQRLGVEIGGSYSTVRFLEQKQGFFDYDSSSTGAALLYHLSPLSSVFGEYRRLATPRPSARPEAQSTGDAILGGIRGEITPLLGGTIRAGYQRQEFGDQEDQPSFSSLVVDIGLTRYFSEKSAVTVDVGRGTYASNYEDNGFYVSNHVNAQFVLPVYRNLRLATNGLFFYNQYPLTSQYSGIRREDRISRASVGLAYYFTAHNMFRVDYLHERRDSNVESFRYRNNVIQLLVGLGFFAR